MDTLLKQVHDCGVIPVIKLDDASDAAPLAKALLDGGINAAEITFRTDAAEESIKRVADAYPDMLVGAGTVLNTDLAKKAINAGAKFIVTPGFNPKVVEYCLENNILVLPGTSNPSDIEMGLSYGLKTLKFFPAETSGGIKALKAMCAPYAMVKFMPTGGIDPTNIGPYLSFDKVIACGGSWMVKEDLIKEKNFAEITKLTKEAVTAMLGFQFAHMGINPENNDTIQIKETFGNIFGFTSRETSGSYFSSPFIEIMKQKGLGECGHIGIKTHSVERAIAYLEKQNIPLDYETARKKGDRINVIYLKDSIGGFRIHLVE